MKAAFVEQLKEHIRLQEEESIHAKAATDEPRERVAVTSNLQYPALKGRDKYLPLYIN